MSTSRQLRSAGFTIVELLVAMAVSSMVVMATYGLFTQTSSTLYEADNLADTTDKARFAIEQIRLGIQSAGSQASPDPLNDPRVRPLGRGVDFFSLRVFPGTPDADNPATSADAIVIIGAIDYPYSFELSNISANGRNADIVENQRGLLRLARSNPFSVQPMVVGSPLANRVVNDLGTRGDLRLLRIMDRQGYMQFATITSAAELSGTIRAVRLDLQDFPLSYRNGGDLFGLDASAANDVGYDAAFVDAYVYYVRADPSDARLTQLVRERLDASAIVNDPNNADWTTWRAPADARRLAVLIDQVADFQIWFECADNNGEVVNQDWQQNWVVPDGKAGAACAADPRFGHIRVAHVRLAIHTDAERANLRHYQFAGTEPLATTTESLQTYDINGEAADAARVITFQADFELPNFSYRNIRP